MRLFKYLSRFSKMLRLNLFVNKYVTDFETGMANRWFRKWAE